MLIRRYSNPEETMRHGRQGEVDYSVTAQWVALDPWETNGCADLIAATCGIVAEEMVLDGWNPMPITEDVSDLMLVVDDSETGFCYYRRPVDKVRADKWSTGAKFNIPAGEWE